jgi:hypothetical protein
MIKVKTFLIQILILAVLSASMLSCTEEFEKDNSSTPDSIEFMEINGDRLHFSSKDFLKQKVDMLKESNGEIGIIELPELTAKGFYSHRPIFKDEDSQLQHQYANRIANMRVSSEEGELIADDNFAFYLNERKEIQVGDSVYVYTEDGVYFVHHQKLDHLNDYLRTTKSGARIAPCDEDSPQDDFVAIDEDITLYAPDCDTGGGSTGGGSTPPSSGFTIQEYVKTLPVCTYDKGWLTSVLGTSVICEEYFSSNHKLKTKFWNQKYLILNSIGISVKSQKKTLGIWFNKKIDEIGYGINYAHFAFNIPMPEYPEIETTYVHNGTVYDKYGKVKGASAPAFPFESPIEIFVKLPIKNLDLEYTEEELNKMFWEQIWNQAKSALKSLDEDDAKNITFVGFLPDKVHVIHSDISKSEYSDGKMVNYFDWNFQIGVKSNINSLSPSINKIGALYSYSDAKIDFYGYGFYDHKCIGSRLIFSE